METTKGILTDLIRTLIDGYKAQLAALPMTKKTRETLTDGYTDGVREGVHNAVKMLGVEVKE